MDTNSKKFNSYFVVKTVAFLLAVCVSVSACLNALEILKKADEEDVDAMYYEQALLVGEGARSVYTSNVFRSYFFDYMTDLEELLKTYGGGTKADYAAFTKESDRQYAVYRERLVHNIYMDSNLYNQSLIDQLFLGAIEVKKLADYGVKEHIEPEFYSYSELSENYQNRLYRDYWTDYYEHEEEDLPYISSDILEKARKEKSDCVVLIPNASYQPGGFNGEYIQLSGYYGVKVNDEVFSTLLENEGYIENSTMTLEEFQSGYKKKKQALEYRYENINYIVKFDDGTDITNVKDYNDDISLYGYAGSNYYMYGENINSNHFKGGDTYGWSTFLDIEDSRILYNSSVAPSSVETSVVTHPDGYTNPLDVVIEQTTRRGDYTEASVYMQAQQQASAQKQGYSYIIYFDEEMATFDGVSVSEMKQSFNRAAQVLKRAIITVMFHIPVFVFLVVLLCALSGRRSGKDKTVYLLPADKLFCDVKLLISGGVAVSVFYIGWIFTIETLFSNGRFNLDWLPKLTSGVTCAVVVSVVLEYIMYLSRKLKSHTFCGSISLVWLFKKSREKILRFWRKFKNGCFPVAEVEKSVRNKTAVLIVVNAVVGFFALTLYDNSYYMMLGLVLIGLLFILDVYVLFRGLKFVGGVSKLFKVIDEYRKGNLDAKVDKSVLPEYLLVPAENLMGLGDGLKVAVTEAVKQEQTKTELITNISHDLKTPLTSIINYVELLKQCGIEDETALSYLEILGEKSDRLKHLITDLVEASKAATGNVSVQLVDVSLKETVIQLIGEHSDAFEKRRLEIIEEIPDDDITVKADSKLLYRILENLIINTEKYAMENTRVYISAKKQGRKGSITIKNISAAPLNISAEQLKQRFVRGDESRSTEGNGLGLSIAENLCKVQGGRLDIEIVADLFIAKVEFECV